MFLILGKGMIKVILFRTVYDRMKPKRLALPSSCLIRHDRRRPMRLSVGCARRCSSPSHIHEVPVLTTVDVVGDGCVGSASTDEHTSPLRNSANQATRCKGRNDWFAISAMSSTSHCKNCVIWGPCLLLRDLTSGIFHCAVR